LPEVVNCTSLELTIILKAANVLDLTIPPSQLVAADEVID